MVGLFSFLLCWVFVALHRLRGFSCPRACRILTPQPEIKPGSPALEGGFLTIGPRVKVIVAQLCLTVCDPMDCSPPGSSVCGILQARILDGLHSLPHGIFLTQGLNSGLLRCMQILYCLSYLGSIGPPGKFPKSYFDHQ